MASSDKGSCTIIAEATAQIVSQKLDILLSQPVCIECLPTQARVEKAKAKLAKIQEFISSQYRLSKTTEWSGRLLRAMYYAEEFIDKFHLREASERHKALHMAAWPLAALVSKCKLSRDLSTLVNMMEGLGDDQFLKEEVEDKRKKEPPSSSSSSSSHASIPWQGKKLARLTSFWDRRAQKNFLCCKAKEEIRNRIKNNEQKFQGTSILGEQGTGKTFLARWAYSQARYMNFVGRAWVHVRASMDRREFLFEILKRVGKEMKDMKDMDIVEMQRMLCQKSAEAKRFLLVLDDVQPPYEKHLQELAMIIPFSSNIHIITTTRDYKIARFMQTGKEEPITLEELGDEESRGMLAWKLRGVNGQRLSTEENILNMCPRLPLCVSLLGGILSNAEEHERAALVKEGSMTLSDILQLSYHKLPVHLKPCFIYMALFPVGFPIPTRRLVRLWLAEGLLDSHCYHKESEGTRRPEDAGETFILELADRSVIDVVSWRADGSPKACQMLTSLHDMIHPIATKTGFLYVHATSKSKDVNDLDPTRQQQQLPAQPLERAKIRWLAEHTNIVTGGHGGSYPNLNLGHLRSFLSFYERRGLLTKDISTFLRKMTSETDYSLLRVLDLEGVYKPSLQGVLPKLVLLRYLGLRSTGLDSLPSAVADLYHLQTLDIKYTNITSLPNSLWKARNLRHLHLNWFYIDFKKILKASSNNVMALTQLQTLTHLVIGDIKENFMRDYMDSLTTLITLKLYLQRLDTDTSGATEKAVADWISSRLTNLQSLTFGVIQEARLTKEDEPAEEDKAPKEEAKPAKSQIGSLPKLSLAEKHHDLFDLYLVGQLKKPIWTELLPGSLRVLTLSGSKVKIDMMPELGGLLRNLRTLRLLANSFLGTSLRFIKDGFPSLLILKIWKLPKLEKVIIEQGAMLHLKELDFRHLDMITKAEGIKACKDLENICVIGKTGVHNFVDHLKDVIGRRTSQYEREDTETPKSNDDDEDDRDRKEEIVYLHIEKEVDYGYSIRKLWGRLGGWLGAI